MVKVACPNNGALGGCKTSDFRYVLLFFVDFYRFLCKFIEKPRALGPPKKKRPPYKIVVPALTIKEVALANGAMGRHGITDQLVIGLAVTTDRFVGGDGRPFRDR